MELHGTNYNYINASIFYNRLESHILIQNFINPFIKEMQSKKMLAECFVYLSSDRGENVRVSLNAKKHIKELGKEFEYRIKSFLERNRSMNVSDTSHPFNFFMNFPNNSVTYELYNHELNTSPANKRKAFCALRVITRMLLEDLSDDQITLASLFTAITYLQVSLLKAYSADVAEAASTARLITNDLKTKPNANPENTDTISDNNTSGFFTNKEIFREIREDVWSLSIKEFNYSYNWTVINKYFTGKPASFTKCFHYINSFIFYYFNVPAYIQNEITLQVLKNSFGLS